MDPLALSQNAYQTHRDRLADEILQLTRGEPFRSKAAAAVKEASQNALSVCFPKIGAVITADQAFIDSRARQKALDASPHGKLLTAYLAYIIVSDCAESRNGYLAGYINSRELATAKQSAAGIEKVFKKTDPSLDASAIWKEASQPNLSNPRTGFESQLQANFYDGRLAVKAHEFSEAGKKYCRAAMETLTDAYEAAVPGANAPIKDF